MERILSLFEEKPTLSVYEYSESCVFRCANANRQYAIHPDFRIFLTYDSTRKSGAPLSQALLNRVMLQRIMPLDEGLNEGNIE